MQGFVLYGDHVLFFFFNLNNNRKSFWCFKQGGVMSNTCFLNVYIIIRHENLGCCSP